MRKKQQGVSLIEVLIVIAIIALLLITAFFAYQTQLAKGRDGQRKADLAKLKIAFEDYYNDNECYPAADFFGDPKDSSLCGGDVLSPYIKQLPCDPSTLEPYEYLPLTNPCSGYRLLANLEMETDPSIITVGCSVSAGICGDNSPYNENNYGVSMGTAVPEDDWENPDEEGGEGGEPTPTPEGVIQNYACTPQYNCDDYGDVWEESGCSQRYDTWEECIVNCFEGEPACDI